MTTEGKDRYPGLRSFEEKDADLFFGRDDEIIELTRTVISERVTIIFGASGCGKSSLLNTVFKKSEPLSYYRPLKIRFTSLNLKGRHNRSLTPLQTADKYLTKEIPELSGLSIVYNEKEPNLWEFVKRAELAVLKKNGQKLILIFDQFEEYFSYSHKEQLEFNLQLAEIVHDLTPTRILQWINGIKAEERTDTVLEWYQQPDIKLIFSIRADKLSAMNSMVQQMPQILRNRMELKLFKDHNARQAIVGPAGLPNSEGKLKFNSPPIVIDPKVVDRIVIDLSNPFNEIEASFLQIVCFTLENQVKTIAKNLVEKFDYGLNLFNEQIDIATILDRYYNESIDKLQEADAKLVKKLIEDKLVVEGIRTSLLENQLKKELGPDHVRLIAFLLNARLIREENTSRGLTYELSHDKLIGPVERSKAIREEQEKAEQQALEAKKKYELQSRLIKQEKSKIEEYKLREEAYRSKEKLRKLSFYFGLVSIALVSISIFLYITSINMKRDARRYKSEYLLANAKDAFDNYDNYLGFNFLWAADSLRSTSETDSLLNNVAGQLLLGNEIMQSEDGNTIISTSNDSTMYIWKLTEDRLVLQRSFQHVRDFFVSGSFNRAAILEGGKMLIWDIEKNSPVDSLPDIMSDFGYRFRRSFSDDGNKLIFVDTTQRLHIYSVGEKGLEKVSLPPGFSDNTILNDFKISRNGENALFEIGRSLYHLQLSSQTAHETGRFKNKALLGISVFLDSAVAYNRDSLFTFDFNTGKLEHLISFRTYFPNYRTLPSYELSPTHIFIAQNEKPFLSKLIDLRTRKPVLEIGDQLRIDLSLSDNSHMVVFNEDGFIYVDSTGRIKIIRKNASRPELVKTLDDPGNDPTDIHIDLELRKLIPTREYSFAILDTAFIANFVDTVTNKFVIRNLKYVVATNHSTILAQCSEGIFEVMKLINRSPLTKKETRRRIPYFDKATKSRYGLNK